MEQTLNQSKLILMEGLPSTGKSTNAGILFSQLERNGKKARWIHEVARPHPTLFFYEAYMEDKEYLEFIARYPHTAAILEQLLIKRKNGIGIDLLDVEWNYYEYLGSDSFTDLKKYDVWNFDLERYKQVAIEKWEHFVEKQLHSNEIAILDSCIFQFQAYTFILADAPFIQLQSFIEAIYKIISPLNPSLIYLYRDNTDDTIDYLVKCRGTAFLERIWERDKHQRYYRNRPPGAESYKMFLRDYGSCARMLFDSVPTSKLSLEITEGNWNDYVDLLLNFLNLSYVPSRSFTLPNGTYMCEEINQQIQLVEGHLITPDGAKKKLMPRSSSEFFIHDLPVIIRLDGERIIIKGEQLCDRWTTSGAIYQKLSLS
ncbi:hypothetical protein [Paenibacillus nasutitermitis]|uniref:Thymidylate kinase n=1 Tax=Paenibacillus nasutitermitis TaxID=1652958 RepID=A0A916ZKY2_9BACL|nr:hypothetical protein [Paenibacillus nasutitermitis]GGE02889.1 hypothetical protein GCM10010911_72450 [Paenibacillus nasutitermitis]